MNLYVSLRIKSAILVATLLLLFASITYYLSSEQLVKQQQEASEQKFRSIERSLLIQEEQLLNHLVTLAEQLGAFKNQSPSTEQFYSSLRKSWEEIELLSSLQALRVYPTNDARPSVSLGSTNVPNFKQLVNRAFATGAAQSELYCQSQCYIVNAIPLYGPEGPSVFVLVDPFSKVIGSMAKIHKVEAAILQSLNTPAQVENPRSYIEKWQSNLLAVTNSQNTIKLINEISSRVSLDQIRYQSQRHSIGNLTLQTWTFFHPSDESRLFPILVIDDITKESAAYSAFSQRLAMVIFVTIAFFALLVFYFSMKPINKIKHLVNQYPKIALHRFSEVRQSLPKVKRWFSDEVDTLHDETLELTKQLETLDNDVQVKNDELEYKATHDELTGLGNRNLLRFELEKIIEQYRNTNACWALVVVDLDNFKQINDTLGHVVGDELLKIVAHRIKDTVKNEDIVCRLGGDEFVIAYSNFKQRSNIEVIMRNLFNALEQPVALQSNVFRVQISAGVKIIQSDNCSATELIKSADLALYAAKDSGRNCYRLFDENMSRTAETNFLIDRDFEDSLSNQEFYLELQPQLASQSGKLVGFEALIRWQHHQHGRIFPNNFIPILEESDKIIKLGRWVAEQALNQLSEMCKVVPGVRIAINMSAKQLYDETFFSFLLKHSDRLNIKAEQIELEITESVLIDDLDFAKKWIKKAHDLNLRVSIDDFGTGYSSLGYISQLDFDTVKLDRSFIQNLTRDKKNQGILSAIIYMVKKMESEVVAEGIEDTIQFDILRSMGCDIAQGFYIQKPRPIEQVLESLKAYQAHNRWPTLSSSELYQNSRNKMSNG